MDTGTINRPLRLRGERGKTYYPFKKHYQIENEKYTQRTLHKGYSLHNIYATNIPKGVGTDSSRPHHQQKQLIVICKILRIAMQTMGKRNTISGNFVDTGTINRPLRLRGERGKTHYPFKKTLPNRERNIYQRITQNDLFIV